MSAAIGMQAPKERWQHGAEPEVAAGVQRISHATDRLVRAGRLDEADQSAANRFYSDWAFGVERASSSATSGTGGGFEGFLAAGMDALTRYRVACQALGLHRSVLEAVVLHEISLSSLAGRSARPRKRCVDAFVAAMKALTAHYSDTAGSRPAARSRMRTGYAADVDLGA